MKFSVVTAVRNARWSISDTLRSVSEQDYPHREHLVIDGASTDGTLEVLEQQARTIRLQSERDAGIYDAFNRGLELAQGDVIAFLNADDLYEDAQVLSRVAAEFERTNADIVFGDVVLVRKNDVNAVVRYYRSDKFVPQRLRRGFMPAHPSMFIRRSVYLRYGGFDASYRIAGDFEWTARVFRKYETDYSYIPHVLVRMRQGGISTGGIRSTILITREIRRACRSNGIVTSYPRLLSRFPEKLLEYFVRPRL